MKVKIVIATCFLATIFLISCKEDKKNVENEKVEKTKTFDVVLNMLVKKDDNFQLFYTEDSQINNFDDKKSIWITVKGSETPQDITFSLPEDVIPTNLRVDLGNNSKQEPMGLNSFKMNYYNKTYVLKDSLILRNFVIGDQLIYDKKTSILTPNQGKQPIYDPLLYPQSNLSEEILKLIK